MTRRTWQGRQPQEARTRDFVHFSRHDRVDAQVADKVEELEQAPVFPRDISDSVGDARANIAQMIPAHLRQEFSASVVNSIRAQRGQGEGIKFT